MGETGDKENAPDPTIQLPVGRVAVNEATSRDINEAIEEGRLTRDGTTGFVCECGRIGCTAVVELTLGEYETVRAHPRRFLVAIGHQGRVDELFARHERYAVVVKGGEAGAIAEETDPRT